MSTKHCPRNLAKTVEEYLAGRLVWHDVVAFESHYLTCPHCAEPMQFTPTFSEAVQRAARRLAPLKVPCRY